MEEILMPIKLSWLSTALVVGLSFSTSLPAHPGRTASDGCHYCRTNCDKWGVPWGERHCHHHAEPLLKLPVNEDVSDDKKIEVKPRT